MKTGFPKALWRAKLAVDAVNQNVVENKAPAIRAIQDRERHPIKAIPGRAAISPVASTRNVPEESSSF